MFKPSEEYTKKFSTRFNKYIRSPQKDNVSDFNPGIIY